MHPLEVVRIGHMDSSIRRCPNCESEVFPVAIKSIMNVSVKNTNLWFKEIFAHFPKNEDESPRIQEPDPEWSKKLKKKG